MDVAAALGVAVGFFVGIAGHEFVTHLVGVRFGDPAPRFQGRVTLDVRKHADPLGTYVLPAVFVFVALFGALPRIWFAFGKSHALSPAYQRGPLTRSVLVPLSGPLTTLVLAALVARLPASGQGGRMLAYAVWTLLMLTAIELLPMPGRDGGRVLARFLPPHAAMKMEELRQYEALFLIGVFLIFDRVVASIAGMLGGLIG